MKKHNHDPVMRRGLVAAVATLGLVACSPGESTDSKPDITAEVTETNTPDFSSINEFGFGPDFANNLALDTGRMGDPLQRYLPGQEVATFIYGHDKLDMDFFDKAVDAYTVLFEELPALQGSVSDLSGTKLFDMTASSSVRPNTHSFYVVGESTDLPSVTAIGLAYPAVTFVPNLEVPAPALSILMPDLYRPSNPLDVEGVDSNNIPVATEICQNSRFVQADVAGLDENLLSQDQVDEYNRIAQEHYCNSASWAVTFAVSGVSYDMYVQNFKDRNDEISQYVGLELPKWVVDEALYTKLTSTG
jgi:hypothetical protein